ncbi:MAG TPA: hypothetical protein DIC60_05950 [Lachnospiraceae bacterium]|nr:hypothetical protein [Lachnospiraceae bacterium]
MKKAKFKKKRSDKKMGNLEKNCFTIFVYLPYLFALISIGFLCIGLYLKTKKKNSKKILIISLACFIVGILIFLVPAILLIVIRFSSVQFSYWL